jgi:hypothetical protein
MAIRTIFDTVQDCSQGKYRGWSEFVRDYAPVARHLLSHYFPALAGDIDGAVANVFGRARGDGNSWFRSLHFANEREFAMSFRELVFVSARSDGRLPPPKVSAEQVFALLEGLTTIQQQLFWMFLKGWDVQQTSAMLMNASGTAAEVSSMTDLRLESLHPDGSEGRMSIALMALEAAQTRKGPDCPDWKTFNNIINGQISWSDREAAERHFTHCVHCLDAFTAFQEMIWLRKKADPLSERDTGLLLSRLKFEKTSDKGLLRRIFSRAS